jgi:hypothetical protein
MLGLKENWFPNEIVCNPEVNRSCSNSKNNFTGSVDSIARNLHISVPINTEILPGDLLSSQK